MPHDDGRDLITVWVVVPVAEHAAAERLAARFAEGGLEEMLAAFVGLLAEAEERPYGVRVAWVNGWITSHPWPRSEGGL